MIRVCFPFVGDSVGGAQISTLLLVERLDRTRFEPRIVLHRDGPLADLLAKKGMPFSLLPLPTFAGQSPAKGAILAGMARTALPLARFLRRESIDLVHSNDLRCNLTWCLPSKLLARHVWHQRTTLSGGGIWRLMRLLTNHVVCISETVRRRLPGNVPASLILNPLDDACLDRRAMRAALLAELGLPESAFLYGYAGRLTARKGVDTLLAAGARLATQRPDAVLVIAGDGPERDRLAKAAPAGTRFLGFRDPIEPVIAGLDALVTASPDEGFGRTLAEAMLAGTPVVASDIAAHREVTEGGQRACLFPPGDAAALADGVATLMAQPAQCAERAEAARQYARRVFGVSSHVDSMQNLYCTLVAR